MKKTILIILTVLWLIGSFSVRIIGLERSPISLGFDEASLGYNAYSLLLTGKDEYGTPHPLSLRSFNDFKPALYAYLSVPFIHFFGLSQTSIRAASAALGTLSLVFLLLIFRHLTQRSWFTSLVVISVLSFFPWHLHFSRVALESNISMAFFTGFVWCLLNFKKNISFKFGAILFSTLSIYSYHSARLAIPILFFLNALPLKSVKKLWPIAVILTLSLPILLDTQANLLLTRLSQTNIFNHFYPFTPKELIFMPNVWTNPLAHPLYYLGGYVTGHLFAYLSPKNLALLIYPGVIKSAQVIAGTGMLGFVGGILFIFGLFVWVKQIIINPGKRILLFWILAGIVPAAVTWEWFYPLRSLNIYPAIDVIAGLGLLVILDRLLAIKPKLIAFACLSLLSLGLISGSVYNLLNEYNYGAQVTNGEFQPGGFKEGGQFLASLKDKYATVYLDTNQAQSYVMLWFYMKYPPVQVQKIASRRRAPGVDGLPTLDFDNFVYKKFDWPNDKNKTNFVYWTSSEVIDAEINSVPGAKLYRINSSLGYPVAAVITKE